MEKLVKAMKSVLASTFTFRIKAQYYHWNVEGPNFVQYHDLFGDIYTKVDASVDAIAEEIRTLDEYAPGSFNRFAELSVISDDDTIPSASQMIEKLEKDNRELINSMVNARNLAEDFNKIGLINFLEGQIDAHEKIGWMLRATGKKS